MRVRPTSGKFPALLLLLSTAVSALSHLDTQRGAFFQTVLDSNLQDESFCNPTGLIEDACCDFQTVETVNLDLFTRLQKLVSLPVFRYHKVNLYNECPFWQEEGSCMNRACGVEVMDEKEDLDIPEAWRSGKLGEIDTKADLPSEVSPDPSSTADEFCVLDDAESDDSGGQFIDLLTNPERFTGYAGHSSSRVWKAIYEENCFTKIAFIDPSAGKAEGGQGFLSLASSTMPAGFGGLVAGNSAMMGGIGSPSVRVEKDKRLLGSLAGPRDEGDEVCLEKRVYYRLLSGLHASISIHICDEYLDQSTGLWSPNLDCFITRIGEHPERLQNVYFTYVVLLRAASRGLKPLVNAVESASKPGEARDETVGLLKQIAKEADGCPGTFDETSMFIGPEADVLKSEFKGHFRNVSRIMDCVGCDKCRLWGKVQVTGLGTALKLLFADEQALATGATTLSREEATSFVNTLNRFSESLAAVEKFRKLWRDRDDEKSQSLEQEKEPATSSIDAANAQEPSPAATTSLEPRPETVTAVASPPSSSPSAGENRKSQSDSDSHKERLNLLARLATACKTRLLSCVELVGALLFGSGSSSSSTASSSSVAARLWGKAASAASAGKVEL